MSLTWADDDIGVYVEASGTFSFNDSDVQWVYVDWDDGEDNSLENAIYQWKKLDTDSNNITLTHTYTKTGSFYPVIRTINSAGFLSKYLYDNGKSSTTIPEPKEEVRNINLITVSDGNPLSTLKVENKIVKSGIDNSIFKEGPKQVWVYVPPLIATTSTMGAVTLQLKVKYVDAAYTYTTGGGTNETELGYERVVKEAIVDVAVVAGVAGENTPLIAVGNQTPRQVEILDIRLITPKWVDSDNNVARNEFNQLKVFLIAQGDDTYWYPITYVSSGDPIKKANDRIVTLDFSQSRTKASNTSLSIYKFDDGKVFWNPVNQWQASTSTDLNDNTKTSSTLVNASYTYYSRPQGLMGSATSGSSITLAFATGATRLYDPAVTDTYAFIRDQFALNDYNQFYDQYHLTRMTCATAEPDTSTLDTFKGVYRITPVLSTSLATAFFLDQQTGNMTAIYTSGAYYNTASYPVEVSGWNTMPFVDNQDRARPASEYLILTNDVKTNKIFFNNTPYAKELMSNLTTTTSGNKVAGVYYLRLSNKKYDDKFTQRAEWVPVNFKDTTKVTREVRDTSNKKYITYEDTMTKSGFIEFDMPSDWSQIPNISGLTGGVFNAVGKPEDIGLSASDYSIVMTDATWQGWQASSLTPFGEYIISTSSLSAYTDKQIGKFQHVFEFNTINAGGSPGSIRKTFWVASSNTAEERLYIASGTLHPITAANDVIVDGTMRVINIYDVFDGVPKATSVASKIGNVPQADETVYPYTFMWYYDSLAPSPFIAELENNFRGVYPLKIVLSGSHFPLTATDPGTEVWDILPFNNTSSQVVIQQDNTAYDLSYMAITSDISVSYAGTYYQAISKGGKVFIKRTGARLQNINFAGNALGDESSFTQFSDDYTTYDTLRLLRRMEAEAIRVMWDEQQKDGTYVRFFGYVNSVMETHQIGGKRASKPFSFTMIIEEICLIDGNGILMSDIEPLGGSENDKGY